jgi:Lon protease-like protein
VKTEIPLFPLGTVLFPEGQLPLRIFETRYTDMVRRCMRESLPFGVVLIQQGAEAGAVGSIADVGTTARVVDFSSLDDGLLGISCVGERRFQLLRSWRQEDGLNLGEIEFLPAWPAEPVPLEAQQIAGLLQKHWSEFAGQFGAEAPRFDDAVWVCARLAQVLPLPPPLKQRLLESDSAALALRVLAALVKTEQNDA